MKKLFLLLSLPLLVLSCGPKDNPDDPSGDPSGGDKETELKPDVSESLGITALDFGLSVEWADMNLGAKKPEDYGDYYAWGERLVKNEFSWGTYLYGTSQTSVSKYTDADNLKVLLKSDDVAASTLGGRWRIPTVEEWEELSKVTKKKWISDGKKTYGMQLTGEDGTTMFLPACGGMTGKSNLDTGNYGFYWTSTRVDGDYGSAWSYYVRDTHMYHEDFPRCYGLAVRAVRDKKKYLFPMKTKLGMLPGALLLLLLCVQPSRAEEVSAGRALEAAQAFLNGGRASSRGASRIGLAEGFTRPQTKSSAPAFYVFNREGGGWVIIAGDDRCKPVLGYSYTGSLGSAETIPAGMRKWLSDFEAQVSMVRSQGVGQRDADYAHAEWLSLLHPTKAGNDYKPEVNHRTAHFDQGKPFNGLCPKPFVGCVPTAMGIIMKFFRYPAAGTGTLPSYSYEYDGESGSITGYPLGHAYLWDKIKDDYSGGYTQEEADAVARLLYDIGVSAQAWYLSQFTDTNFWRLIPAVAEHFGYSRNVTHIKRWYFTDEQWMDLIKADLQDHPLIYAAGGDSFAHAFVVDGYDSKNYLSINWGWGGSSDGYFALSAFAPYSGASFPYDHTTVLGLVPDRGDGGTPNDYLTYVAGESGGFLYNGLSCSVTPERGKEFMMNAVWLVNGGLFPLRCRYFFALVDSDGQIVEKVSAEDTLDELPPFNYSLIWQKPCKISVSAVDGDCIKLFYRSDSWPEGEWRTPLYDLEADIVSSIAVKSELVGLEKNTSIRYDITSSSFELKTADRVKWTLTDSGGTLVASGESKDGGITVSAAGLPRGSYLLTLTRGKEQKSVTLKMGKQ